MHLAFAVAKVSINFTGKKKKYDFQPRLKTAFIFLKYGLLVTCYLGWKEVLHDLYFYMFIMRKTEIQVRNHNAWERTTRQEKWHSTYLIVTPSKEDILFNTQTPQKMSSRTEQSLSVWKKHTPNVSPLPPQYYQTQHFWPQRCGFSTHRAIP